MPRRPRKSLDEYRLFHVTARGAGGCAIFVDELDRLDFADCFWDAVLRFELKCLVACQMGTHYHAVIEAEREQLSEAMRKLNGSYAGRFNLRHERRGHLFGARFSSWVIESESHLAATILYALWNPVRAGLCELPDEWRWSWLNPTLSAITDPLLASATGSDCPMGQSLRRARERRRRARLRETGDAGQARCQPRGLRYRERDALPGPADSPEPADSLPGAGRLAPVAGRARRAVRSTHPIE